MYVPVPEHAIYRGMGCSLNLQEEDVQCIPVAAEGASNELRGNHGRQIEYVYGVEDTHDRVRLPSSLIVPAQAPGGRCDQKWWLDVV